MPALLLAILPAVFAAGCTSAPADDNVRVFNESHRTITVSWQQNGSFGYLHPGSEQVGPCSASEHGFSGGSYALKIEGGASPFAATLEPAKNRALYEGFVVKPDGQVDRFYSVPVSSPEPTSPPLC